jgi:Flp pilus assembly protein TadG
VKGAKMRSLKRENGASAVEFAIILPLLVLLIFGIIEFSLALYDKAMITNASREGARVGIVYRDPAVTDAEITSVVNNYLENYLITFGGSPNATVTVTRKGYRPGGQLSVTVAYTYISLILPNFSSTLAGGINMGATTMMRME